MPLPVVTNPGIKPQRKTTDFQISLLLTNDTFTQVYAKVSRWQPVYARRPVKESLYLGLQTLGTLSDDLAASRHAKYVSQSFEPANIKQKILESMCRVLEADYSDLMTCTT
ncbi:hypothetical protein ACUWFG_29980, partial [Escherichia coli]